MADAIIRVLVVDDQEADYVYARELLREVSQNSYVVDWAENYATALKTLEDDGYDVYLFDQHLGPHSGVELLADARQMGITRPIIMLAGVGDSELDRNAMRQGASDFLVKGELSSTLLERSIRYALERERMLAEMERAAMHDALTGLANRRQFSRFCDGALARARRSGLSLGLILLDLDYFKQINDTHGHDVGDGVLVHVAKLLEECVRRGDLVARLGGDEFAIVADNIGNTDNMSTIAEKVLQTFAENPLRIGTAHWCARSSLGIAVFPDHADDFDALLKAADTAMYAAKRVGRNTFQTYETPQQLVDESVPVPAYASHR